MTEVFALADEFGPAKIVHVYEPSIGLKGILVVDNVAAGPAIGGMRMAPDVSLEECFRLARAMSLKNAAAGLPHGGGKSVLFGDPKMAIVQKECLIRAMACALRDCRDYIFGPDMGTDESCMAWIHDEIGRAVGLPNELGGLPLDEFGATAYGLVQAIEVAAESMRLDLKGARVVVQGFGAVGRHAARMLSDRGAVLAAAADSRGAVYDPAGLPVAELIALKESGRGLSDGDIGQKLDRDAVIDIDSDIWIPAARPDVLDEHNVHRLRTRLVAQGANIPFTLGAEEYLHHRKVICLPDFIVNAGGVICASMELQGAGRSQAFQSIKERIRANTRNIVETAERKNQTLRQAAEDLAVERLRKAMATRRWSIY
ncbi:glutamate dehydrogenase [Syntrophotalea acetylenivorans]|uniref:Glutamate dehydrogenase n=1 Tax=Syntrophotalea acetylenivorans TaxID=1842532 RepID=A0A1L3GMV3_9BACT|nr:Glu/Leu/Phe/Val dehydrogenase [Syntrophotalea acetylenivorans]APG27254.1 glutamate dehydrogenase [Syntrophotalea acetylenivorans]